MERYHDSSEKFVLEQWKTEQKAEFIYDPETDTGYFKPVNKWKNLPPKPQIIARCKIYDKLPVGKRYTEKKSRQIQASSTYTGCVAKDLICKTNFWTAWGSTNEDHSKYMVGHRIYQGILHLEYPFNLLFDQIKYRDGSIRIEYLNTQIDALAKGSKQLNSYTYNIWMADEFGKIEPKEKQAQTYNEGYPALEQGKIFIFCSAEPDCKFDEFSEEKAFIVKAA